jgi:hypothetical protein
MTLVKLEELRWGNLALKVLRSKVDGSLFVAMDPIGKGESIRGPFLSEQDLSRIVSLVRRHGNSSPEREFPLERVWYSPPSCDAPALETEIEEAVRKAQEPSAPTKGVITVLPTMPPWRYRHTCPVCGCHVQSRLCLGSTELKLCAGCEHVESVFVNGTREG